MLVRRLISSVTATQCRSPGRCFSTEYLRSASVYIHWPYCARKCIYCDFNKYVSSHVDQARIRRCLLAEVRRQLDASCVQQVASVFFGGGTPSLAPPSTVEAVLASLSDRLASDAEVTLEANPTSATGDTLRAFREAGVTRLSLGVQALDDAELRWLGRDHSSEEAISCLRLAATLFPGRVSADLLIGRPRQSVAGLRAELRRLLALSPDHLSLYQLTAARGTQLYRQVVRGETVLPSSDQQADLYRAAVQQLADAGLERYEVANFARPGHQSRHNALVWCGRQYAGVGPGAHGRLVCRDGRTRRATVQTPSPERWMGAVEAGSPGSCRQTDQTPEDVLAELVATSLRTVSGLTVADWRSVGGGLDRWQHLVRHRQLERLRPLLTVSPCGERLTATARGLRLLDSLLPELLNVMETYAEAEVGAGSSAATGL